MLILLLIYISLLGMSILSGFNNCFGYAIHLDLNRFNTPYFCFGIDYHREFTPRMQVSVLVIGFVAFNLTFEFFKLPSEDMEEIVNDSELDPGVSV